MRPVGSRSLTRRLVVLVLAVLGAGLFPAGALAAQTTPPPYTHSWYITDASYAAMDSLGASDGAWDDNGCRNSFVVLDFGQVGREPSVDTRYDSYGAYIPQYPYPFKSDYQILHDAQHYAAAWYHATGACPRLHLIIGLNNQNECPKSGLGCSRTNAGTQWAKVLAALTANLVSNNFDWQITAWAGDDMETGWDSAAKTRDFVDGFNANAPSGSELIDYGDAWSHTGWTTTDVYYVAYGATHDWPLPEIYSQAAADRWTDVRVSHYMYFRGVMSTTVGNSANTAWQQLWDTLNANGVGQSSLDYSTRIKYQP
jgi:hypothetical protein